MTAIEDKLKDLEKALGKGPTFSPTERNLVLKHGVCPWLIVGSKVAKGALAERCLKAIDALAKLHDELMPALPECLRPRSSDG